MFSYAVPEGRGGGYGVVTDRYILAVGEHFPLAKVIELWELLLLESTTIEDALSLLAKGGIANIPDFALVELVDAETGSITVAVRGKGVVKVGGATGRVFEGAGAVTWIEASAQRIGELVMSVGEPDHSHLRLPFKRGVVRTDHMFWGIPVEFTRSSAAGGQSESFTHRERIEDGRDAVPDDRTLLSSARSKRQVAAVDDATILSTRKARPVWELEFESGVRLRLDEPVVVGRAPKSPDETLLEALPSPTREVSGTHARLEPTEASLTLTDLDSTNGTVVTPEGSRPILIHAGASHELHAGDRVDFGDGNVAIVTRGTGSASKR